ncbi:MAG: hypothetical protein P8H62_13205 [Henriciella sp.]|nr:hypothetical protein [Henriciella sp.]
MFHLKPLSNNEIALARAPMIRAAGKLLGYLVEHQTIGLTQTKAFQRSFVLWAAEAFEWPGFDLERYFAVSKVMNEYDFPPLENLHFILLKLKLIRHYKLTCRLTKSGSALADKPGDLFNLIAPFFLFRIDHATSTRTPEPLLGNWDVFLGILNVEAEGGVSSARLREILYGAPDPDDPYDRVPGMIYSQVLSPLCAMGLLVEGETKKRQAFDERPYVKTPLWAEALRFPFDPEWVAPIHH